MDDAMLAWVGGVGGALLGVAGGVFGTWMSLRSARSGGERRLVWQGTAVVVLLVGGLLAGLLLLPEPYNWLVWLPYPVVLTRVILAYNRRVGELRADGLSSGRVATGPPAANGV